MKSKELLLAILENQPDKIMESFGAQMDEKLALLIENRIPKVAGKLLTEGGDGNSIEDTDDELDDWYFDDDEQFENDDENEKETSTDERTETK